MFSKQPPPQIRPRPSVLCLLLFGIILTRAFHLPKAKAPTDSEQHHLFLQGDPALRDRAACCAGTTTASRQAGSGAVYLEISSYRPKTQKVKPSIFPACLAVPLPFSKKRNVGTAARSASCEGAGVAPCHLPVPSCFGLRLGCRNSRKQNVMLNIARLWEVTTIAWLGTKCHMCAAVLGQVHFQDSLPLVRQHRKQTEKRRTIYFSL